MPAQPSCWNTLNTLNFRTADHALMPAKGPTVAVWQRNNVIQPAVKSTPIPRPRNSTAAVIVTTSTPFVVAGIQELSHMEGIFGMKKNTRYYKKWTINKFNWNIWNIWKAENFSQNSDDLNAVNIGARVGLWGITKPFHKLMTNATNW